MREHLLPATDEPESAPFWAAAREERLVVQHCQACDAMQFPPLPWCRHCLDPNPSWRPVSGRGHVWSWAIVHKPVLPVFADVAPFPIIVVELEDTPRLRICGNVIARPGAALNSVDPAALSIGLPVTISFERLTEDVTLPQWLLAGSEH